MKSKGNGYLKITALILFIIVLAASLVVLFKAVENYINKKDSEALGTDDEYLYSDDGGIYFGGEYYFLRDDIETLLILGIDSMTDSPEKRENSLQSDFIALVVIDEKSESYRVIQLSRDTITKITKLDKNGKVSGTYTAQLALAHTYGETGAQRCRNAVDAVENLLYGIEIEHYLSLTMDAVPILNDSVGGVTLELADDFTFIDETYEKGAVVTLMGEVALAYVQARSALDDSTNLHRMERQKQYIGALLEKYNSIEFENMFETMVSVSEYMVSDCTVDQLSRLAERAGQYSYNGVITLDGESKVGEDGYMEYHIDEATAQKIIIEIFYEIKEQE